MISPTEELAVQPTVLIAADLDVSVTTIRRIVTGTRTGPLIDKHRKWEAMLLKRRSRR